jgi:hypothetical protein
MAAIVALAQRYHVGLDWVLESHWPDWPRGSGATATIPNANTTRQAIEQTMIATLPSVILARKTAHARIAPIPAKHPITWNDQRGFQLKKLMSNSTPQSAQINKPIAANQPTTVKTVRFMPNITDEPRRGAAPTLALATGWASGF